MKMADFLFDVIDDVEEDEDIYGRRRIARRFRLRPNHMEIWSEEQFFIRFRLTKKTVKILLDNISPRIEFLTKRNCAMSATNQLLLTLRFYATGSMLVTVGDFSGVHKSTAHRVIKKVTAAIAALARGLIKMPQTEREIRNVKEEFYNIARFPKVVGCIDCTHVKIQSPGGNEAERYRNRKSFFSINVQVCCDANMKITNLVARWPGSTHDQNIFNHSRLKMSMEADDFRGGILLGDSGYALKKYLLTPLRVPRRPEENAFNVSHIRTRNVIERLFGIWKRRFPILSIGLKVYLDLSTSVIVACGVLHNLAVLGNEEIPPNDIDREFVELEEIVLDVEDNGHIRQPYFDYFNQLP